MWDAAHSILLMFPFVQLSQAESVVSVTLQHQQQACMQTHTHTLHPMVKHMLGVYKLLLHDVLFMVSEVYPFMSYHIFFCKSPVQVWLGLDNGKRARRGDITPQDVIEAIIMLSRRDVQELMLWRRGRHTSVD